VQGGEKAPDVRRLELRQGCAAGETLQQLNVAKISLSRACGPRREVLGIGPEQRLVGTCCFFADRAARRAHGMLGLREEPRGGHARELGKAREVHRSHARVKAARSLAAQPEQAEGVVRAQWKEGKGFKRGVRIEPVA